MIATGMSATVSAPRVSKVTTKAESSEAPNSLASPPAVQIVSPITRTRNMNRIRARPAASPVTKRAHRTTTPTTVGHQFSTASQRTGSANQPSQLTAYGLVTTSAP